MGFFGAFFAAFFAFFAINTSPSLVCCSGAESVRLAILPIDFRIRAGKPSVKRIPRKKRVRGLFGSLGGKRAAVVALAGENRQPLTPHAHLDGVVIHLALLPG